MSSFTQRGTDYLRARAIDDRLAYECGVREDNGAIVWPTVDAAGKLSPRRRRLGEGGGPKVRGLAGRTLGVWWPLGRPERIEGDLLICEGESDAMAAVSALGAWAALSVASITGTGFRTSVLVAELLDIHATVAALAFDGDMAGGLAGDRIAWALIAEGIGTRILAIPSDEDLASVLGGEAEPRAWLAMALLEARPVGLETAALIAENRWLRRQLIQQAKDGAAWPQTSTASS